MVHLSAFVRVLLLSVGAAIAYGLVHDQITARICVEYFTIGHPRIFGSTTSPTLLALGWGVVATWWAGAIIGTPLAAIASIGPWRPLRASELVKPVGKLLLGMAICALAAGMVGGYRALHEDALVSALVPASVPAAARVAFVVDLFAHTASYAAGFLGGPVLWWHAAVTRSRRHRGVVGSAPGVAFAEHGH